MSARSGVAVLSIMILVSSACGLAQTGDAPGRTQYFPDTTDGIHLEMVFNYNVTDPKIEAGVVDMVW
jgi:hypothetical protein